MQTMLKFVGIVIFYIAAILLLAGTYEFNLFFAAAGAYGGISDYSFVGAMVILTWIAEVATVIALVGVPFLLYKNVFSKKSVLLIKVTPVGLLAITYLLMGLSLMLYAA